MLSFRQLTIATIIALSLGAATIMLWLSQIKSEADGAVDAWSVVADDASGQEKALRGLVANIGFGGMIDSFKSYVLTGRSDHIPLVNFYAGAALASLRAYRTADLDKEETAALETIESTIRVYLFDLGVAEKMRNAGASIADIDRRVRIDDTPAMRAIETLLAHVRKRQGAPTGVSKPYIMFDLRLAMGYRGLVHRYKNYILRHEAKDLAGFNKSLAAARDALARYRRQPLSHAERMALATLDASLLEYQRAMSDGRLEHLFVAGEPPERIYSAMAIDQRPAIDALEQLDNAILKDEAASRHRLTFALARVSFIAGLTVIMVAGSLLIMIAAAVWIFGRRIVGRVERITDTMKDLAAGRLDADIPWTDDKDEIGTMARSVEVFRDSLQRNLILTKELSDSTRLTTLGALVAGITLELNTPIGDALTVATTLDQHIAALKAEAATGQIRRSSIETHVDDTSQAITLLVRSLSRAADLIGSFKQLAVDQTSERRRQFQLDAALHNVTDSFRPGLKDTRYSLVLDAERGILIDGYPGALSQIVIILIDNCLRHGFEGRASGRIEVSAKRTARSEAEIIVHDNGIGIEPDLLPRIFEAFFTTKPSAGGSGLGLHVAQNIVVNILGGRIFATSTQGEGASFVIRVPVTSPHKGIKQDQEHQTLINRAA